MPPGRGGGARAGPRGGPGGGGGDGRGHGARRGPGAGVPRAGSPLRGHQEAVRRAARLRRAHLEKADDGIRRVGARRERAAACHQGGAGAARVGLVERRGRAGAEPRRAPRDLRGRQSRHRALAELGGVRGVPGVAAGAQQRGRLAIHRGVGAAHRRQPRQGRQLGHQPAPRAVGEQGPHQGRRAVPHQCAPRHGPGAGPQVHADAHATAHPGPGAQPLRGGGLRGEPRGVPGPPCRPAAEVRARVLGARRVVQRGLPRAPGRGVGTAGGGGGARGGCRAGPRGGGGGVRGAPGGGPVEPQPGGVHPWGLPPPPLRPPRRQPHLSATVVQVRRRGGHVRQGGAQGGRGGGVEGVRGGLQARGHLRGDLPLPGPRHEGRVHPQGQQPEPPGADLGQESRVVLRWGAVDGHQRGRLRVPDDLGKALSRGYCRTYDYSSPPSLVSCSVRARSSALAER
mmetsp:Transcript_24395/g.76962  ORF Transcript_24395/g.76962 Transcript_24395/m.76962 type:complete len:455 (+) Transcript_24395:435-1799(+)